MNHKVLLAVAVGLILLSSPVHSATSEEFEKEVGLYFSNDAKFCWKGSYGRGIGSPLDTCPSGFDKEVLLCQEQCKSNYKKVLLTCVAEGCPKGKSEFSGLCWSKLFGVRVKPSAKDVYARKTKALECKSSLDKDGLLCYPECKDTYNGVGPVCWRKCGGDTPADCGAACATSKGTCASKIFDMVKAVAEMISNIAAMVGTGGTSAIAATSAKQVIWQTIINIAKNFKAKGYTKQAFMLFMKSKGSKIGTQVSEAALSMVFDQSDNPIDAALAILSTYDPTGIVNVVIAFKNDVC